MLFLSFCVLFMLWNLQSQMPVYKPGHLVFGAKNAFGVYQGVETGINDIFTRRGYDCQKILGTSITLGFETRIM